jgi:hypothetical protein
MLCSAFRFFAIVLQGKFPVLGNFSVSPAEKVFHFGKLFTGCKGTNYLLDSHGQLP